MHVCIYEYLSVYINYLCIQTNIHTLTYVHRFICTYIHTTYCCHTCKRIHIMACSCTSVCMYVCMYVCMCALYVYACVCHLHDMSARQRATKRLSTNIDHFGLSWYTYLVYVLFSTLRPQIDIPEIMSNLFKAETTTENESKNRASTPGCSSTTQRL